jgi:hypothetical protein
MNVGASLPYISVSGFGQAANDFVIGTTTHRLALAQYTSHAVIELGINDINREARTEAQLRSSINTLLTMLPAGMPTWLTTMPPYTNAANTAIAGAGAARIANNNWRRGIPAGFAGVFEVADVLESARDSGIWGSASWTSDGLHETAVGLSVLQASTAINPGLLVR